MKYYFKPILSIVLIIGAIITILLWNGKSYIQLMPITIVLSILFFNLLARRRLYFKNYFLSKFNIFTAKYHAKISFELPKDILFEKFQEVLKLSKFKLMDTENNQLEILAITPISFLSWGENLYFKFTSKNGITILDFYSTTFFQSSSHSKNEKNFKDLMIAFNNALII